MDANDTSKARDLMSTIAACQEECWEVSLELAELTDLKVSRAAGGLIDVILETRSLLLKAIKDLENEVTEVCNDMDGRDSDPPRSFLGREV